MIREMPPGAEWTLHYSLADGEVARTDFARLQGHPEVREASLNESVANPVTTLRIQLADDLRGPQDPALLDLSIRRGAIPRPIPDYGWVSNPADPTARVAFPIQGLAHHREGHLDRMPEPFRREYAAEFSAGNTARDAIPAGIQPIIDFDPNLELLAETHRLARIRREVAMMVPDPDLPPLPLGPDSINLSPEMMAEYRRTRQEITVLGPDIGNPEQWWRRQADGLLGRTVSRPANGQVRLRGFANAADATLDVPFDTFIRDWLPTEDPNMPLFTLDGATVKCNGVEVQDGQFCRRIRDGLTGHVRGVPGTAFDSFTIGTDTIAVSVKVAEFFRDWSLVPEPEAPSFWDRLLAEDS